MYILPYKAKVAQIGGFNLLAVVNPESAKKNISIRKIEVACSHEAHVSLVWTENVEAENLQGQDLSPDIQNTELGETAYVEAQFVGSPIIMTPTPEDREEAEVKLSYIPISAAIKIIDKDDELEIPPGVTLLVRFTCFVNDPSGIINVVFNQG